MDTLGIPTFGSKMLDIVICVAFAYQVSLMYIKFVLHLRMSEIKLPVLTKMLFALLLGSLAFFGDFFRLVLAERTGLTVLMPLFSSLPGVVITVVVWIYFVIPLKFKPLHALELAVYTYLLFQTATGVTRLISAIFFVQDPIAVDYQKYLVMYAVNFLASIALFSWMHYILQRKPELLIVKGIHYSMPKKSVAFAFFQLFFIYICAALIMILIPKTIIGSMISLVMLILFSAFSITLNSNRYAQTEIRNKETQLKSIFASLDQFGAVKHDFYNILQTYNGYFEIGDLEALKQYHRSLVEITTATGSLLDLSHHAPENPALVSLLLNKHERAEALNIRLDISIKCPLSALSMDEIDICRIVGCLIDNAIEAAIESKEKRASFTIEWDENHSKRIIVTNSSPGPIDIPNVYTLGFTSKEGHLGIGLASAKKIIERYPHCMLRMHGTDNEVVARLELESIPFN